MQDWQKSGNGNTGDDESGFNWKSEKNEAMKHYSDYVPEKAYKYEPMPSQFRSSGNSDSLFHQSGSGTRKSGYYSPNGFGTLKYDFPGNDDTYEKYSPKSSYDESIFINASKESVRTAAQKRSRQESFDHNTKLNNKNVSQKKQNSKKSDIKGKKKTNAKTKSKSNRLVNQKSLKANTSQKQRPAAEQPKRSAKSRKNVERPIDKIAYEREKKAEANRRKKIQRSNESYNNAKAKGKSGDELRRKRSKRAKRTGKFYAVVSVCVLLICAISFLMIFCYVHGAPIETITVEGLSTYSESEVLKAAGITKGNNMFRIRKNKTNNTVSKTLPYIESVDIDYQLPSTIKLTITETKEKYLIVNGSNYICVDENGKIVSDKKKKAGSGKYRLDGFEKQEYTLGDTFVPNDNNKKRYNTAKEIVAAIEKSGIKNCSVINLNNLDEICITCDSKIKIYVESGTDFERRMKLAAMAIDSKVKSSGTYYIDLRYSDMAVLKDGELK